MTAKWLGAAAITITILLFDFLSHLPSLGFTTEEQHGWSVASTVAVIAFALAFATTTTVDTTNDEAKAERSRLRAAERAARDQQQQTRERPDE